MPRMTEVMIPACSQDPPFIKILLSQEEEHDCYFIVGNEALIKPERIGVVKRMLMAHSPVFTRELKESKLAEKGNVVLSDIYPDSFKNLLRYVYGYDNTSDLSFYEADNLLYTAEKYMIDGFKDKLSVRLMALLNTDNICILMNNPVCYKNLELNSAITQILQYETRAVLASPHFLDLTAEAFVNILKQDALEVPEIDVWRAAITWAKNKAGCEDGQILRKELSGLIMYIRICTMSYEDVSQEVVQADVLTTLELALVGLSLIKREKQVCASDICCDMEPRKLLSQKYEANFDNFSISGAIDKVSRLTILTKKYSIELLPLVVSIKKHGFLMAPEGVMYQCECTVEISEITDYKQNANDLLPVFTVRFNEKVEYGENAMIPMICNGENVILLPNKMYIFKIIFVEGCRMYFGNCRSTFDNEHFTVRFEYLKRHTHLGHYSFVQSLFYRPVM